MSQPAFDFGDEALDDPANPTYTVSELAEAINDQLRRGFFDGVWVRGEISGWSKSAAGHIYFDLLDPSDDNGRPAKLRVAFFAGAQVRPRARFKRAGLKLGNGLKVRVFGYLDFHAPSGGLSLRMTDVDTRYTLGELSQARDAVMRKLVAGGLYDANRGVAFPRVPLQVGVVTSVGTAAWHDFHHEMVASEFGFELRMCDTRVQGAGAEHSVAAAIRTLSRRDDVDCVVVIRGGGARNELATFDAEPIALAIATSPVPVMTGLGHEIDRSVADEVAHASHKTPTACARAVIDAVAAARDEAEQAWSAIASLAGRRVDGARSTLVERAHRIGRTTHAAVERADERLATRGDRLAAAPSRVVATERQHVQRGAERVARRLPQLIEREQHVLDGMAARLALLDPVNLLRRGWSITRDADGNVVRSVDDVAADTTITTELADGRLTSRIEESTTES